MKGKLSNLFLILWFLLAAACCSPQINITNSELYQEQQTLSRTRQSVVAITTHIDAILTSSTTTATISNTMSLRGTGFILGSDDDATYIGTVGHLCDLLYSVHYKRLFPHYNPLQHYVIADVYVILRDQNNEQHVGKFLNHNWANDTCVVITERFNLPGIDLAKQPPLYGEKLYSLGYPSVIGHNVNTAVPVFPGYFSGTEIGNQAQETYVFTIPTVGGGSGSMVINSKGELISIIHSVRSRMPHVSYGATLKQLKYLIKDAQEIVKKDRPGLQKTLKRLDEIAIEKRIK